MIWVKRFLIFALISFVVMQFFRVDKNTAEGEYMKAFVTETNPPDEVIAILKVACYDCHSNNTRYPWYAEIAPVSYWLDDHIRHGKGDLNFSEWESYSVKKKDHKMEEVQEMLEKGEMPLDSYTWTHGDARLTDEQKEAIYAWVKQYRAMLALGDRPQ
ncbi:MAG: heme-binding domain-containing protein [Gilvibacter sp.]